MYPETDVQPILLAKELITQIKIPELITEKAIKLEKKYKISSSLAQELVGNELFTTLTKQFKKLQPTFIAKTILEMPKEIQKRFNLPKENLKPYHFESVLEALNENKIEESAVLEILADAANNKKIDFKKYKKIDSSNLDLEI